MEEKLAKTAQALGIAAELSLDAAMDKREEEIKGLKILIFHVYARVRAGDCVFISSYCRHYIVIHVLSPQVPAY